MRVVGEGGEGMVGHMGLHMLGRFCPDQLVTRGQMATFPARATGVVATPSP